MMAAGPEAPRATDPPTADSSPTTERCWPNSETIESFDLVRVVENGDEVIVTYEGVKTDGRRFRNTEVLTFEGDRIRMQEVYFGWDVG